MDTSSKLFRSSAAALAAGGFCWVTKFVVIAATDGAVSGLPDTVAGILYIAAVVLMAGGMAGLGVALLSGRHPALRPLGAVAGVLGWVAAYALVATAVGALAPDTGTAWLDDELEIVVTGALLMTVGLLLARRPVRRTPVDVGSR